MLLRNLILKIDKNFLGNTLQKTHFFYLNSVALNKFEKIFNYKIVIYYEKNITCKLSELCDIYGSDKGEITSEPHPYPAPSHTYTDFYSSIFGNNRNSIQNVFECGIGSNHVGLPLTEEFIGKPGASLRVWRDYFPNAHIYGADINKDVLFQEDRISTFYVDQLDCDSIKDLWEKINATKIGGEVSGFDLIIDDGLHTFEAGVSLFQHSIGYLHKNGVYVIEDVSTLELSSYQDYSYNKQFIVQYVCLHRPKLLLGDNNLVVIRKN